MMGTRQPARRPGRIRGLAMAAASALLAATQVLVVVPTVHAATNDLRLSVVSARDESRALGGAGVSQGDPVPELQVDVQSRQHRHDRAANAGERPLPGGPGLSRLLPLGVDRRTALIRVLSSRRATRRR